MNYRRLGNAGTKVSEIALGGWTTFGASIEDLDQARSIITTAYENGINFFDIADAYANGESERMMGAVLQDFPRHTLVISSKLYWPMSDDVNDRGLSRKHIMESIDKSLQRIGTDYLDIYFCHRYDAETPLEETVRAMDDLIHQGKILYWGTSEWSGAQIASAVGLAQRYNLYPPQVEQPGYNLTRRQRVEQQVLPVTELNGIGLTTFSPLASGILTGKYDDGIPKDSRMARNENMRERFGQDARQKVLQLKPIAQDLGLTRAQLALAWILRQSGVSSVITGASKPSQVEQNVQAAGVQLDDDVIERINALFPID
jgi:voltage-dependent potassium channel beta subunit